MSSGPGSWFFFSSRYFQSCVVDKLGHEIIIKYISRLKPELNHTEIAHPVWSHTSHSIAQLTNGKMLDR